MRDPSRKVIELLDGCRAGVDDLRAVEFQPLVDALAASPALTQALQRSQQLDQAIGEALRDVPEPAADFEARLFATLAAAASAVAPSTPNTSLAGAVVGRDDPAVNPLLSPVAPELVTSGSGGVTWQWVCDPHSEPDPNDNQREVRPESASLQPYPTLLDGGNVPARVVLGRRTWWRWTAGLLAIGAALAAFLLWGDRGVTRVDDVQLAAWVPLWQQQLVDQAWQREAPPIRRFPLAKAVPGRVQRWQTIPLRQLSVTGCCYDLTVADGGAARLLVIPASERFRLSPLPPPQPRSTQGESMASWVAGKHVYVLTFADRKRYTRILRQPATAAVPNTRTDKIG